GAARGRVVAARRPDPDRRAQGPPRHQDRAGRRQGPLPHAVGHGDVAARPPAGHRRHRHLGELAARGDRPRRQAHRQGAGEPTARARARCSARRRAGSRHGGRPGRRRMIDQVAEKGVRRVILGFLLGGLLLLSYAVLHMFIVPEAWAVILAFATWPAYRRLRASMRRYPTLSALLMTLLLSAAFVLPALWMGMLLRTEVGEAIAAVT